jgi:hypothetical protein
MATANLYNLTLSNYSSSQDFSLEERKEKELTSVQKNLTTD